MKSVVSKWKRGQFRISFWQVYANQQPSSFNHSRNNEEACFHTPWPCLWMTMARQTSSPYWTKVAQRCLSWFDDKSESTASFISVAGITRCRSQIDYLSNLKANNDVIISSLEERVECDIDEEKFVHYANRSDLSLSLFHSFLSTCIIWLYVHHQCFIKYHQIARLIKWWIFIILIS